MRSASNLRESFFIVLEGIDGAGKTTVAKAIVERLKDAGVRTVYTFEPFYKAFTDFMNDLSGKFGATVEALLLAADRYCHLERVIKPCLKSGVTVVSDRYYYSSIAYQSVRGADLAWVRTINNFVIKPDIAIYLDISAELGLRRKRGSDTRVKYLERDVEAIKLARKVYLNMVSNGELILVDASKPLAEVVSECEKILCKHLGLLC